MDTKPKCRVEVNEKVNFFNENKNKHTEKDKKPTILAPTFDPFSFVIKDIPNCIVNEYSYLMHEEVSSFLLLFFERYLRNLIFK